MLSSGVNAFLEACATSAGDAPKPASLASCALPTAPSALSALDQSADAVAKLCRLIANLCITPDLAAIVIRSKAFDALPLLLHLVCTTRTVRGGGGSALPEAGADDAALPHAPELLSTVISMVTNASFFVSPADVNRAAEAALVAVEAAMKLDAAAHGSGTPAGWHVALALSSSSTYGGHGLAGVLPSLLVLFADVVAAATAQLLASALEAASEESAAALAFQEQVATECLRAMSNIVRSPSARLLLYTIASDAASSDASYTAPASSFPAALVCLLHGFVTASELEEECTSGRLAWCYNGDIVYTLCGVILNLVADPCWRMGAAMPQHGVALLTTVRAAPALRTAVEHAAGEWQRDLWQRLCQPSSLVDLLCAATSAAYSGVADDSVATVCMQALVNYCQGWRRDPVVASDGGEDTGGAVGVDAVDARFSYAQALSLLTLLGNILDDAVAGEGMDTPLASVALQLRAEIKDMVDEGAFFDANE
ncbi:MAG: hypothetical protein EOO41_03530 [Methanobacteriota archaeon]|nr:MAG: hypothetical protein EOO41_03530 [Euryarchaeota archaeon]